MISSLLLCTLCTVASPMGGLPGVHKDEKQVYPKGDLFRMRNEMLGWYCNGQPGRSLLIPCKVYSQLKKNRNFLSDNGEPSGDPYWNADVEFESSVIDGDKNGARKQYSTMFQSFCKDGTTTNKNKICENALFINTYSLGVPSFDK